MRIETHNNDHQITVNKEEFFLITDLVNKSVDNDHLPHVKERLLAMDTKLISYAVEQL